ncbi:MAG: zinc ribbon domain-containing protein [Gemmatimonadetes bacterium]|nr:zinc ribbon domain-containing protein [Gemmatimonadota bacterium]
MTQTFRYCPSCGAPLQGRFCSACGTAADAPHSARPAGGRNTVPYVLGAALVVALLGSVFWSNRDQTPPPPLPVQATGGPEAGTPPDLSAMTTRERFDRLFERIMRASEGGDSATVRTFSPMAFAAYGMLEAVDADARFHAAMLRIATGDAAGAAALADTIGSQQPGHLFAPLIRGSVARLRRDPAAAAAAHREFLAAYPAQIALTRPEYTGHQNLLDNFLKEAKP